MPTRPQSAPYVFDGRFTLAQVEWALWRRITNALHRQPSAQFKMRLKHLLQLDRSEPLNRSGFAFSAGATHGSGEHNLYSAFDALILNVGLDFIDVGFKRKEVVMLLRDLRPALRDDLSAVMAKRFASCAQGAPLFEDLDPLAPENRIALMLARVEDPAEFMVEPSLKGVLILRGMKAILQKIEELPLEKLVIIEVGASAYLLPSLLLQAPIAPRGRKPKRSSRTGKQRKQGEQQKQGG